MKKGFMRLALAVFVLFAPVAVLSAPIDTYADEACTANEVASIKVGDMYSGAAVQYQITSVTPVAYNGAQYEGTVRAVGWGSLGYRNTTELTLDNLALMTSGTTHRFLLTDIASGVFNNDPQLTKLTINGNVKTIRSYTFSNCSALTNITIHGKGLKKIEKKAFANCIHVTDFEIHSSKFKASKNAFKRMGAAMSYGTVKIPKKGYKKVLKQLKKGGFTVDSSIHTIKKMKKTY